MFFSKLLALLSFLSGRLSINRRLIVEWIRLLRIDSNWTAPKADLILNFFDVQISESMSNKVENFLIVEQISAAQFLKQYSRVISTANLLIVKSSSNSLDDSHVRHSSIFRHATHRGRCLKDCAILYTHPVPVRIMNRSRVTFDTVFVVQAFRW